MKLLIIRHGQSEADILDVHEGRADYELTELGHIQAKQMAEYVINNYSIDRIYSSPLKRAVQTANYIAQLSNKEIIFEDKLMEFNNGLIAGMNWDEAEEKYPYMPDIPLHTAVYEQESKLEFRYRAEYILSKIISEAKEDDTIVVVSHGGMINQLYHAFLKLPIEDNVSICTADVGIHEWKIDEGRRAVLYSNRIVTMI